MKRRDVFVDDDEAILLYHLCKDMAEHYQYTAEKCQNDGGKPCKSCMTVLRAKELIADIEAGE